MLTILLNRTYRQLFAAQVIALLGTGLLTVALGLLAYDLAGEEAGAVLGTALAIKMVAYVGLAPIANALAERLPRLPDSLETLDLLLISVAKSRLIRRDGIHFQGLRYMEPTLAAYVGEAVTIRYDPRDITEIRVFHRDRFLCRAICPDHADRTISLKDIQHARIARRKELRGQIASRIRTVTEFLPDQGAPTSSQPKPTAPASSKLALYKEAPRS